MPDERLTDAQIEVILQQHYGYHAEIELGLREFQALRASERELRGMVAALINDLLFIGDCARAAKRRPGWRDEILQRVRICLTPAVRAVAEAVEKEKAGG